MYIRSLPAAPAYGLPSHSQVYPALVSQAINIDVLSPLGPYMFLCRGVRVFLLWAKYLCVHYRQIYSLSFSGHSRPGWGIHGPFHHCGVFLSFWWVSAMSFQKDSTEMEHLRQRVLRGGGFWPEGLRCDNSLGFSRQVWLIFWVFAWGIRCSNEPEIAGSKGCLKTPTRQ